MKWPNFIVKEVSFILLFLLTASQSYAQESVAKQQLLKLNESAQKYWRNDPDSAILLAKDAIKIANELNDSTQLARAYTNLGGGYFYQGAFKESVLEWKQALQLYDSLRDSTMIASVKSNLGLANERLGQFLLALNYHRESLSLKQRIPASDEQLTASLNNLGVLYVKLGDAQIAKDYFNQALALIDKTQNQEHKATVFSHIAGLAVKEGDFEKATHYYQMAYRIQFAIEDHWGLANSLNAMGLLLLKMQQYEAAIYHLNESLDWAKKLGAGGIVFRNYLGLAEVNIAQNKYEDAVLIAKLAKRYQREESYSDFNEQRYLRILYQAYDQQNRINEAYETLQDLQQLNEKLLNAEVARQIGRMEAQSQYEIERLQEQRFQMQKEAQYQATITKQRVYLLAGLLIGVILLFFGVAYARSYTLMKRKNILLQQQKEEIEFLKDHLDDLVKERTREVEEKGQRISNYAYTNAHHLRGPLARILALIDAMKLEGYPSQKEYQFSLEALYKSAREMDKVVRDINEQLGE